MTLSKNIRYLRKQKGWGQDVLADKLGYKSYTTIQKWESGVSDPPLKVLHKLALLFNVDMDDLNNKDLTCTEEWEPKLTAKDERDIRKDLDDILNSLDSDTGLMFDGEAIDDETKELLAASGWILGEIEDGNSFPAASLSLEAPAGSFVNLLVLDMDSYAEQYGSKAVRRNITVPAWLDTYAQKNHLSLSKVVQDSLLGMAQKER